MALTLFTLPATRALGKEKSLMDALKNQEVTELCKILSKRLNKSAELREEIKPYCGVDDNKEIVSEIIKEQMAVQADITALNRALVAVLMEDGYPVDVDGLINAIRQADQVEGK